PTTDNAPDSPRANTAAACGSVEHPDRTDHPPRRSARLAPAATVVASTQPVAVKPLATHMSAPAMCHLPSCPTFTLGTSRSAVYSTGFHSSPSSSLLTRQRPPLTARSGSVTQESVPRPNHRLPTTSRTISHEIARIGR